MTTPTRTGTIYHHYQDDIAALGRKRARAEQSDSGLAWAVFPASTPPAELRDWIAEHMPRVRTHSEHDCSGRYFSGGGSIARQTATRLLVTQSWGYDI